jgi:hypothetical protein
MVFQYQPMHKQVRERKESGMTTVPWYKNRETQITEPTAVIIHVNNCIETSVKAIDVQSFKHHSAF